MERIQITVQTGKRRMSNGGHDDMSYWSSGGCGGGHGDPIGYERPEEGGEETVDLDIIISAKINVYESVHYVYLEGKGLG